MSRRARRRESPRKNDSRPTIPFSVPDKNIDDRPTRGKYYWASLCPSKDKTKYVAAIVHNDALI